MTSITHLSPRNSPTVRRSFALPACVKYGVAFFLLAAASATALAQKPVLVQSLDEPARSPYQQAIIFNQGASTCTAFVCLVSLPAIPAGKRLQVTYVSYLYGAPSGNARVSIKPDNGPFTQGAYLPLPQSNGANVYAGGSPVTLYVEAGNNPTVSLEGLNVASSSTSAQVMVVGHLISVP
jgi:hypothetical protein